MNTTMQLNKIQIEQLLYKYPAMDYITKFKGTIGEFYERFSNQYKSQCNHRQEKIISSICKTAQNIFEKSDIISIENALKTNYMVSTAEHHASITYSESLNVVFNQFLIQKKHKLPLISLSCSTTTLDNELFPRGIFYNYDKIPFLPASYKNHFAYNAPSIKPQVFKDKVKMLKKNNLIEDSKEVLSWFESEYDNLEQYEMLWEQVSVLNKNFWKSIVDQSLQYYDFNYFMIPSEKVAYHMLIEDLNTDHPSWVFKTIFDHDLRKKLLKTLDGTRLCWDIAKKKGTFLFWGFKENGKPVQLFAEGNYIISKCKTIYLELEPETILEAIEQNIIVPASNLFFLYSVFYAGMTTLGGILQVNYLAEIQQKLIENNPLDLSEKDLEIIKTTPTNTYVNFQRHKWNEGGLNKINHKLTGNELIEYENCNHFEQIQECLSYLLSL